MHLNGRSDAIWVWILWVLIPCNTDKSTHFPASLLSAARGTINGCLMCSSQAPAGGFVISALYIKGWIKFSVSQGALGPIGNPSLQDSMTQRWCLCWYLSLLRGIKLSNALEPFGLGFVVVGFSKFLGMGLLNECTQSGIISHKRSFYFLFSWISFSPYVIFYSFWRKFLSCFGKQGLCSLFKLCSWLVEANQLCSMVPYAWITPCCKQTACFQMWCSL